jgi:hypothetical protein
MIKGSPSKLDLQAQCPRYAGTDRPVSGMAEAANEGTLMHEAMALAVQDGDCLGAAASKDLNEEQTSAIFKAWEMVLPDLSAIGMQDGIRGKANASTEMELAEDNLVRRGFADLVVFVTPKLAIIKDWKMVRVEGIHDFQLKAYAVKLFAQFPELETVMAGIVAPRIDVCYSETFVRSDIPKIQQEITYLLERVENPFTPAVPCDVCGICKWNGNCPAQSGALAQLSQTAQLPLTRDELLDPKTPEQRAKRRLLLAWVEDAIESLKKQDNEWADAGGTMPGFGRVQRKGLKSLKKEMTPTAIQRLVSSGIPMDAVLSACKLSIPSLATGLAPVMACDSKSLRQQWDTLLGDLMESGSGFSYLQRTCRKPIPEQFAELSAGN